jgi:hypothetical protein
MFGYREWWSKESQIIEPTNCNLPILSGILMHGIYYLGIVYLMSMWVIVVPGKTRWGGERQCNSAAGKPDLKKRLGDVESRV